MSGKTLKLFVLGNEPDSLKTVELGMWTGKAIVGPRTQLAEALKTRDELRQPSIYFLLANDQNNPALTLVYIGEAEDFSDRVRDHERKKDWWETFVVFGSKDRNLTKAHIRHLERWFYDRAKAAGGRVRVLNDNTPPGAQLPESDEADIEIYGQNALFVLGALGYRLFDRAASIAPERSTTQVSVGVAEFEMNITRSHLWPDGRPAMATMRVEAGKYLLLTGSAIRTEEQESFKVRGGSYWNLWKQLIDDPETLEKVADGLGRLKKDVPFNSPSAAAAVVRARTTNGRVEWKVKGSGKSFQEWEDQALTDRPQANQ
jgi:hypothetical protein